MCCAADVHSIIWAQAICAKYMETYDLDAHLEKIRKIYKHKCELMLSELEKGLTDKIKHTKPQGGLFIWATLPEGSDMMGFCKTAVEEYKIAVVPGTAFAINETDKTTSFRLNFSTPTDEQIIKGCEIFGKLSKEMFDK